jgi:hypothetical protein
LALSFGVAACDGAAVWQRPAVNARVKIIAMFFVLMGTHPHTILYFSITYFFVKNHHFLTSGKIYE